jgi:hypothetical protein
VSPVCDVIKISNGWFSSEVFLRLHKGARRRRKELLYCDGMIGIQPIKYWSHEQETFHTLAHSTPLPLVPFYTVLGANVYSNWKRLRVRLGFPNSKGTSLSPTASSLEAQLTARECSTDGNRKKGTRETERRDARPKQAFAHAKRWSICQRFCSCDYAMFGRRLEMGYITYTIATAPNRLYYCSVSHQV